MGAAVGGFFHGIWSVCLRVWRCLFLIDRVLDHVMVFVGIEWVLIAIVLDYLCIILLFQAAYYEADVFVYYAVTFLIPGWESACTCNGSVPGKCFRQPEKIKHNYQPFFKQERALNTAKNH